MNTLKMLQVENQLQQSQLQVLDSGIGELVKNEAINKKRKTNRSYSSKIKAFAFNVYYYSPKVYRYLRNQFTLPAPRTIRRWLEAVDCHPGFQSDVLDRISEKDGPKLYSLVLDSMSIRKRTIMQQGTGTILGHVDYGGEIGDGGKPGILASEALVFLLVPLLSQTRHVIGYFLVDKIDAQMQASLVTTSLQLCQDRGIQVVNITCDGAPSNISTLQKLGGSVPDHPFFKHPTASHNVSKKFKVFLVFTVFEQLVNLCSFCYLQVHITLDPAHMIKLCRNAFAELKVFVSDDGEVNYRYVEELIRLQDDIGLKLGNKVRRIY